MSWWQELIICVVICNAVCITVDILREKYRGKRNRNRAKMVRGGTQ